MGRRDAGIEEDRRSVDRVSFRSYPPTAVKSIPPIHSRKIKTTSRDSLDAAAVTLCLQAAAPGGTDAGEDPWRRKGWKKEMRGGRRTRKCSQIFHWSLAAISHFVYAESKEQRVIFST